MPTSEKSPPAPPNLPKDEALGIYVDPTFESYAHQLADKLIHTYKRGTSATRSLVFTDPFTSSCVTQSQDDLRKWIAAVIQHAMSVAVTSTPPHTPAPTMTPYLDGLKDGEAKVLKILSEHVREKVLTRDACHKDLKQAESHLLKTQEAIKKADAAERLAHTVLQEVTDALEQKRGL